MTFSFASTCDADKARNVLQTMFVQSLPQGHDAKRIGGDAYDLDDSQAVEWLAHVLCNGHFISWQFFGSSDDYVITLRA